MIEIRWSTIDDAPAIATLHRDAWRNAYAGIIPGPTLERMVSARGPRWWRSLHAAGARALVVEIDPDSGPGIEGGIAGYASLGRLRRGPPGDMGEIYELYLRPECQGIGLGRRLFSAARAELSARRLPRLHVWALADNQTGCRFYRAVGGEVWTHATEVLDQVRLEKIGFRWR